MFVWTCSSLAFGRVFALGVLSIYNYSFQTWNKQQTNKQIFSGLWSLYIERFLKIFFLLIQKAHSARNFSGFDSFFPKISLSIIDKIRCQLGCFLGIKLLASENKWKTWRSLFCPCPVTNWRWSLTMFSIYYTSHGPATYIYAHVVC